MSRTIELGCDVLVIGAGPARIAASVCAAESGSAVILVDDNPRPGGQIWRAAAETENGGSREKQAALWLDRLRKSSARLLLSTCVVARLADRLVLAENKAEAIEISFGRAILATGARELMLPFPGWTLPNVFAPGGLQALVKSGFPVEGKRIVVAGTGPLLLAVAAFLKSKQARIEGVYDQASWGSMIPFAGSVFKRPAMFRAALGYGASLRSSPYRCGWWPVSAKGTDRLQSVTMTNGTQVKTIECDMLACGFHLVPNTELQSAFGCVLAVGKAQVDEWQRTTTDGVFSVGESTGIGGLDLALVEGQIAGLAAAGKSDHASRLLQKRNALVKLARAMDRAFALRPELRRLAQPDTIVCRCEDVRWSSLQGQQSVRPARLYTRCGMGPCQGRVCGAALQFLFGWESAGTRPPVYPALLSTLIREPHDLYKEKP
ncbi:MAG TPA: FAD/NAD(P)-binding oxidoreductase [Terracidiphilus sp.]|nr:FAD/NAD(P)-binding oxidoreductase [Terracidiphilus sp.]